MKIQSIIYKTIYRSLLSLQRIHHWFVDDFFFTVIPGKVITVKWPTGWVVLHEDADGSKVGTESSDPNDHYRPWLEQHVGRQHIDWQWRFARDNSDNLEIKFRMGKTKYATIAALIWLR